jgi:hypothetical protein
MAKRKLEMEIINPNAAGIDIGSRSHFVAINQDLSDVREFGVYAQDMKELLKWLLENDVKTVAMESTGSYSNQWEIHQKYPRKEDRCTRLYVDSKVTYPRTFTGKFFA